jgi:hypothetical protein
VPLATVPTEPVERFRAGVIGAVQEGWRLAALFG